LGRITFLSDPNSEVIRRYDLLHVAGGPAKQDISRPAEFLLDSSGTVRWVNFTEDVRGRARADEMRRSPRNEKAAVSHDTLLR
jgi:peroxiredoxin